MKSIPQLPARSPHKYVEISCPDCGDVRFYKRRHLFDGPGEEGFICTACGEAHLQRQDVSDWYVLSHDPFGKRRLESKPDFAETLHKDPAQAIQALLEAGRSGFEKEDD